MKRKAPLAVWIGLVPLVLGAAAVAPAQHRLPVFFVPNRGPVAGSVQYLLRAPALTAYFSSSETRFDLGRGQLSVRFAGANRELTMEALDQLPGKVNYFIGDRREDWQRDLSTYGAIAYRGLYPGIDLVYSVAGGRLKSEFYVSPGADPGWIRWRYDGASQSRIEPDGELLVTADGGELREQKPAMYQDLEGRRVPVASGFRLFADGSVGFATSNYDPRRALVIDPILSYSTYLGGSGLDNARAIAVDGAGNAYIAGETDSSNLPVTNPLQAAKRGSVDAFVAKLNGAGTALVYCTYLGGSLDDRAFGIAVDGSGNAYLTGWTYSTNFPTTSGARQRALAGGRDAFVAKLNASGNALLYSTYLGGSGYDSGNAIAVDSSGAAYVAGDTYSTNFPVLNALESSNTGRQDAFVSKLNASGSALVWSTYLGGYGDDRASSIAVDSSGNAYVTGGTTSTNFPTYQALQSGNAGGQDAFVAKLASDGRTLVYGTYLGGSGGTLGAGEMGTAIQVDAAGNAYVAGFTSSTNFPVTANAYQAIYAGGTSDAFVAKLNPSGSALLYSTYLGGAGADYANGIAVAPSGAAAVAGYTSSSNFPVSGAAQPSKAGGYDGFLARLNPLGTALEVATYWGGSDADAANAVAMDRAGNMWIAGQTLSTDFPLKNPVQPLNAGGYSAFVAKIGDSVPTAVFRANNGNTLLVFYGSTAYANAGGFITCDPGISQSAAGDTFVAGRNDTTRVYMNIFKNDTQTWAGWVLAGDQKYGNPAVAAVLNGEAYVVARDWNYNYCINHYRPSSGFEGWVALGGGFASEPSIAAAVSGTIYLVGRKSTGVIWSGRYVPGSGFQGWIAGPATPLAAGKPAIAIGSDGSAYVAIRAVDLTLWMARLQGDVWGTWFSGGGQLGTDPDLAASGGMVYAAVTSLSNGVYVQPFLEGSGNGWQGWTWTNGHLSRASVASVGGRYFVTGRSLMNELWWYESAVGWTYLSYGGAAAGDLTASPK